MIDPHTIQGCRWAEPTLFQDTPLWIASERFPWTCHVDGRPERVDDATLCRTCLLWTPRPPQPRIAAPRPDEAPCGCDLCRARDAGMVFLESK